MTLVFEGLSLFLKGPLEHSSFMMLVTLSNHLIKKCVRITGSDITET